MNLKNWNLFCIPEQYLRALLLACFIGNICFFLGGYFALSFKGILFIFKTKVIQLGIKDYCLLRQRINEKPVTASSW